MNIVNHRTPQTIVSCLAALALLLSGCIPADLSASNAALAAPLPTPTPLPTLEVTALPTRPPYQPGELVEYTAQTGDNLPALAARFNTSIAEIRAANPILPQNVTTLPPGMPMQIPIYYLPLWGTSYQILPDALFVDGPAQVGFDTRAFIDSQPGWLNGFRGSLGVDTRDAAEIIDSVATQYSVSPRLLLALIEYQAGGLTQPAPPPGSDPYFLSYRDIGHRGLYMQLGWAANALNNWFYTWRDGALTSFTHPDGRLERPDPWQNAATVSLHLYFSRLYSAEEYARATSGVGFAQTYAALFGDPWQTPPHIPGSLEQPPLRLPFELGKVWAFTGGPHTGWGEGEPYAALDFAPPSVAGGCNDTDEWATAVASGVISRAEPGLITLDLDGDGDEKTGWVIFYLHLDHEGRLTRGMQIEAGQPLGHPSCERGRSTGTHVHIARKYNGEWIPAGGAVAFNLEGWISHNGSAPYQGTLVHFDRTISACTCSSEGSHIESTASQ